jgi:hypothetical protein
MLTQCNRRRSLNYHIREPRGNKSGRFIAWFNVPIDHERFVSYLQRHHVVLVRGVAVQTGDLRKCLTLILWSLMTPRWQQGGAGLNFC